MPRRLEQHTLCSFFSSFKDTGFVYFLAQSIDAPIVQAGWREAEIMAGGGKLFFILANRKTLRLFFSTFLKSLKLVKGEKNSLWNTIKFHKVIYSFQKEKNLLFKVCVFWIIVQILPLYWLFFISFLFFVFAFSCCKLLIFFFPPVAFLVEFLSCIKHPRTKGFCFLALFSSLIDYWKKNTSGNFFLIQQLEKEEPPKDELLWFD